MIARADTVRERERSMSMRKIMPLAGLLVILGCTHQEAPPAPPAGPQSAERESIVETSAVVQKVDQTTREVRLRAASGKEMTVVAGPQVRNLAQVHAGDTVRLTYLERVAASMAKADAGGPATAAIVTGRAPEGGKPGALVGTTVDMVVEFQSYDPATGLVTFKMPDGLSQQVVVSPAMREFAAARRPGERVAVQLTSAMAVSIVKAGA
jgi:hypothetical protein